MADLSELEASDSTKIIGSSSSGDESNYVGANANNEVYIRDTHDNGGLDTILNLTTTPSEGKVGVLRKTNRKYVIMEALNKNVKWGFSNTTQSFDLFKSQLIMVPIGENTEIWFKMSTGIGDVAFSELS